MLHGRFTHCDDTVQVLHSHAAHCEKAAQVLHSHFTHCEKAVQVLHTHFTHCEKAAKPCMIVSHTATAPCKPCTVISHTLKRLPQAFPKTFWPLQCSCKYISQEESEPHSNIELTLFTVLGCAVRKNGALLSSEINAKQLLHTSP